MMSDCFDVHWLAYPEPVRRFLKEDRQWHRALRIKHAAAQLRRVVERPKTATTLSEIEFWRTVLSANMDEPRHA
jgi:hypothetical protein